MASVGRYLNTMTEAQMRTAIIDAVSPLGGRVFWVRDSRATPLADWPDLELILPHRRTVAHVELKSQSRIVTPGQATVLALLRECENHETFIVRPEPRLGECSYDDFLAWLEKA
jgi:hypothetical protein